MEVNLEPGKYVVAVSGGVDSVVLLDILVKSNIQSNSNSQILTPKFQFVVAHFDHGIRQDSKANCDFVAKLSGVYGLEFHSAAGKLGPKASEATAREARYKFLNKVKTQTGAKAIITAHHQDDLVETIMINILRGTGRKGLSPMLNNPKIIRPLLKYPKQVILDYAQVHKLEWYEDVTNFDQSYLRNYLRQTVMPKLDSKQRQAILDLASNNKTKNQEIDATLDQILGSKKTIDRQWFTSLSNDVAKEVMTHWLRQNRISFDKKTVERLVVAAKTQKPKTSVSISGGQKIILDQNIISLGPL